MKKLISLILVLCVCSFSVSAFAALVENEDLGVAFYLSDDWVEMSNDEEGISFYHKISDEEYFYAYSVNSPGVYTIEIAGDSDIVELCRSFFSDESLARDLEESNYIASGGITITTDSEVTSFEYYAGIKYCRYEKAYTAHAYGYYDTPFYATVLATVQNGKAYFFNYERNYSDAQHFADVSDALKSMSYDFGAIKIVVDGNLVYPDSAPVIVDDRTLVPIRAVAEKMGAEVAWDGDTRTVTVTDAKTSVYITIGSDILIKNDEEIVLDVIPIIINGRTYLPVRAVAEALDATVGWDGDTRTVTIDR